MFDICPICCNINIKLVSIEKGVIYDINLGQLNVTSYLYQCSRCFSWMREMESESGAVTITDFFTRIRYAQEIVAVVERAGKYVPLSENTTTLNLGDNIRGQVRYKVVKSNNQRPIQVEKRRA